MLLSLLGVVQLVINFGHQVGIELGANVLWTKMCAVVGFLVWLMACINSSLLSDEKYFEGLLCYNPFSEQSWRKLLE